jgi:hypothetical protein
MADGESIYEPPENAKTRRLERDRLRRDIFYAKKREEEARKEEEALKRTSSQSGLQGKRLRPTDPYPPALPGGKLQDVLDEQRAIHEMTEWDRIERARICAERNSVRQVTLNPAQGKDSKGKGKSREEGKGSFKGFDRKGSSKGKGDSERLWDRYVPITRGSSKGQAKEAPSPATTPKRPPPAPPPGADPDDMDWEEPSGDPLPIRESPSSWRPSRRQH